MTTQTPDAVREAVDARVEIGAKALGLHRIPGGNGSLNPPTRWPTGPQDKLSGRDGTVPLTWDFAEQCRSEVRAILAALDSRAGDAGEAKAYRCRGCGWRGSEPIANGHPQNGCDLELMVHDPIATPAPAVDAQEGDDEGPCTTCYDTGITIQTERACSCEAGDQYRAPAVDAVPAGEVEAFRRGAEAMQRKLADALRDHLNSRAAAIANGVTIPEYQA